MSGVRVTGDFKELAGFVAKLGGLRKVVPSIAKSAAPAIQAEVVQAFREGHDAFGEAYAPNKGGGQAFASLRGSPAKVTARGTSVFARVTRKVPRYMNRGRKASARGGFMPARPIIPDEGSDIPPAWLEALEGAAEKAFDDKAVG